MSLDLDALRVFVRVAELGSFTEAAQQLAMPKARASAHVQKLEAALGARLLQRSTRVVRVTAEGERLLARARVLLAEADELGAMFADAGEPRGRVRLEVPVTVAREVVVPRLPEFVARHPGIELEVRASDQVSAALREGLDVVLRIGPAEEQGLVGRRIGVAPMANYASPAYLSKYGTPRGLDDLAKGHVVVHYAADATPNFEYLEGRAYRQLAMRSLVTVDTLEAYVAACVAGLGIVQAPRDVRGRFRDQLVEVLPGLVARPSPVSVLHTHGASAPRRVRVVINWITELMAPMLCAAVGPP